MPAMWCVTPNAPYWWYGTDHARDGVTGPPHPRRSSKPRQIRPIETVDCPLDLTARYSDIAQGTIIQLIQILHRGPAIPTGSKSAHPNPDPARSSPEHARCRGLDRGRGCEACGGHLWSPCP